MFTIGAFGIIVDDVGRVLLCHRRDIDMWNLPGGGMESGELPPHAVIREVKEETGFDVAVGRLIGVYGKPDRDDLVFAFACEITGGQLTETDESDACCYFAPDDIPLNTNPKQVERVYDALKPANQAVFKLQEGPATREWLPVQRRYATHLQKIFEIRAQIADVHPLLEHVSPVAIVDGDQFLIFDVDPSGKRYTFVKQAPTPMLIPQGVRAAFPLECYGGKPACVVTDDVFDTLDGYVTILHEFVHCYQYQTCEDRLKATLSVARQAQTANDLMWEINYPFPYDAPDFVETYAAFLEAAAQNHHTAIRDCRARLRNILRTEDFEYMIWQEWKEGLARYTENLIKQQFGLAENHGGAKPPFSRVTFYEGGARLIAAITAAQPELAADIEKLFHRIEAGSWMLEAGCWKLEAGSWMLEAGSWMLEAGCWMLKAGCWKLDARSWMLEAGCWKLDAGSWMLEAGSWKLEAGCWKLEAGNWKLETGSWKLDAGSWKLEAGNSSIQYPVSSIQYPVSSIQYPVSSIQYLASSIQHPVSSIQYPVSSI